MNSLPGLYTVTVFLTQISKKVTLANHKHKKWQQALPTPLLPPIPLQPQSHPSTRQQQPLSQAPSPHPSHDAPLIRDMRPTPLQPQGEVTLTDSRDIASLPLTRKNYRKKFSGFALS